MFHFVKGSEGFDPFEFLDNFPILLSFGAFFAVILDYLGRILFYKKVPFVVFIALEPPWTEGNDLPYRRSKGPATLGAEAERRVAFDWAVNLDRIVLVIFKL